MDLSKKRVSSLPLSARSRQTSLSKRSLSLSCSKCLFCTQQGSKKSQQSYFPTMINKALYTKYASSQNYYYTRGFNEFLTNARTPKVISFKDLLHYEEDEEYLKRFYKFSEYDGKIKMLTEYYKFHRDIARMFMLPLTHVVNRYHDRKRRLEYFRVTKMLKDQNALKDPSPVQEKHKLEKPKNNLITDRVLDDLETTEPDARGFEKRTTGSSDNNEKLKTAGPKQAGVLNKEYNKLLQGNKKNIKNVQEGKGNKDTIKATVPSKGGKNGEEKGVDQSGEVSVSHTIQELNVKLGEIISTSYSGTNLDLLSYFENSEQQPDETISNLNKFLSYIQVNDEAVKLSKIPAIGTTLKQKTRGLKSMPTSCRSPDSELKFFEGKGDHRTIDPYNGNFVKNYAAAAAVAKQLPKESNLAEDVLKKVSIEQLARNTAKKTMPTDESSKNQEGERQITGLGMKRLSGQSGQAMSAGLSAKPKVGPSAPVSSMKIQNFEEALNLRQRTSPPKIESQRSTSREGLQTRILGCLSQRTYDAKQSKYSETKQREALTTRRSSQNNLEAFEPTLKTVSKNKQSYNNTLERNGEPSVHTSQNLTTRPNSNRDMRISLDLNALGRQISQNGSLSSTITAYIGKTGNKAGHLKVHSSTLTNFNEKLKPSKTLSSGLSKGKEIKHLNSLGQMDLRDKDIRSVPTSASKRISAQSQLTARGDYTSSTKNAAMGSEQEIINMKHNIDQMQRKALTHREINTISHHKHTKSEVKFGRTEDMALTKKSSLPHPVGYQQESEQIVQDQRKQKQAKESSPSKQVYTYNHNNIVNIFVQPSNNEKIMSARDSTTGGTKGHTKKSSLKLEKDIGPTLNLLNPKLTSAEVLIKYGNQQQPIRRSDVFENTSKQTSGRESPTAASMKKEDAKLTKSKSSSYGNPFGGSSGLYSKSLAAKPKGKVHLDLMEKKIKVSNDDDDYEILLKFKGK